MKGIQINCILTLYHAKFEKSDSHIPLLSHIYSFDDQDSFSYDTILSLQKEMTISL